MKPIRNGLLITAIFALAACCTVCGTRDAHAITKKLGVEPVPQSLASNPDSGEPDAGSTRTNSKTFVRPSLLGGKTVTGRFTLDGDLLRWVGRIWFARYLRTGL